MKNKFINFFITRNQPHYILPWHQGLFYNAYESNQVVTIFFLLAPFARMLRVIYFHLKFGSNDLRGFYREQIELRKRK
jgi:hypothetical protein